jgi:hypothetical protein
VYSCWLAAFCAPVMAAVTPAKPLHSCVDVLPKPVVILSPRLLTVL